MILNVNKKDVVGTKHDPMFQSSKTSSDACYDAVGHFLWSLTDISVHVNNFIMS